MMTKLRVRIGGSEVDCEGSESFVRENFPSLIAEIVAKLPSSALSDGLRQPSVSMPATFASQAGVFSVSTFAARMNATSGSDLVLAASAKLGLTDLLDSFTRQQILDQMKSATAYFRESYTGNLTKYINTLVRDGKLNEVAGGKYALAAASRNELTALMESA